MTESRRPPINAVLKALILGAVVGCILGVALGLVYGWFIDPVTYSGGTYPNELTKNYQDHYIAMVIDSYATNRNLTLAQDRLRSFDTATKISALGQWSANYSTTGRGPEAQAVNELAANLKQVENWDPNVISTAMGQLAATAQNDSARQQAVNAYGQVLGVVPQPTQNQGAQQPTVAPPTPPEEGGLPWLTIVVACVLILLVLTVIVLLLGRWQRQRSTRKAPPIAWEGEGPAPIKRWAGTYTLGQENYDEFFTIETDDGTFLGESGMGILETVPGASPKQVIAFDVGLFDKTDITTLSRVVMSEYAYNDPNIRAKVEANPQAEAILAEPGKKFALTTSAMRVEAKVEEMEYGPPGGNTYFNKLKLSLTVFIKEGADLKVGTMDVPEQFR